jgi:hypothetical protein
MNSHSCLGAILMASAARRLPDDPILIAFNVPIEQHLKSLDSLHAEINGFFRTMSGRTCSLIPDMRTLDLRCSDFSIWIEGTYCSLDHPSLHVFAAGTRPVMRGGLRKIEHQLRVSIAVFDTIGAAQRVISDAERV